MYTYYPSMYNQDLFFIQLFRYFVTIDKNIISLSPMTVLMYEPKDSFCQIHNSCYIFINE